MTDASSGVVPLCVFQLNPVVVRVPYSTLTQVAYLLVSPASAMRKIKGTDEKGVGKVTVPMYSPTLGVTIPHCIFLMVDPPPICNDPTANEAVDEISAPVTVPSWMSAPVTDSSVISVPVTVPSWMSAPVTVPSWMSIPPTDPSVMSTPLNELSRMSVFP